MSNPASNTKHASYIKIPQAVYAGLDNGSISIHQFDILVFGYRTADRADYQVHGYSAANVCRFRQVDATPANRKMYQREAYDLWQRDILRRDYYQMDTHRSDVQGRPYSIWLPRPERFMVIGTPAENALSLWKANVAENVPDNVAEPADGSAVYTISSRDEQYDNVADRVPEPFAILSLPNQEDSQNREKDPLNPPSGDFSHRSSLPSREEDAPAGVVQNLHRESKAAGKKNPLDANQCDALNDAATLYIDVVSRLFGFSPAEGFTQRLLRIFTPTELLFAHIRKTDVPERVPTKVLNNFYASAARVAINAARILGTSTRVPETFTYPDTKDRWRKVSDAWEKLLAAWNTAAPNDQHDDGFVLPAPPVVTIRAKMPAPTPPKPAVIWHCKTCGIPVPDRHMYCSGMGCENLEYLQKQEELKQRCAVEAAEKESQRLAAEREECERKRHTAIQFLKMGLQDGAGHPSSDVMTAAHTAGITSQELNDAFSILGCVERELATTTTAIFGAPTEWQLPTGEKS